MEKMKEEALRLGLAVYRVTKLFPGGEVLIGQTRETANHLLSDLIFGEDKKAAKRIETLLGYFRIARAQGWIKAVNFDILIKGYSSLLDEIRGSDDRKEVKQVKREKVEGLNQRQKKILDYIKDKEIVKLKEMSACFPDLKPRTIRSDLGELVRKKILSQQGMGRGSIYKINKS